MTLGHGIAEPLAERGPTGRPTSATPRLDAPVRAAELADDESEVAIRGRVLSLKDGAPIPDAVVTFLGDGWPTGSRVSSDSRGFFLFAAPQSLAGGTLMASVEAEGFFPERVTVETAADNTVVLAEAQLRRFAVVDEDGRPIAGATVMVAIDAYSPDATVGVTDEDGMLHAMAPWRAHRIVALANGYQQNHALGYAGSTDGAIRIPLQGLPAVRLAVMDEFQRPVSAPSFSLRSRSGQETTCLPTVDADGDLVIYSLQYPSGAAVIVSASGYASAIVDPRLVEPGQDVNVVLTRPGAGLLVRTVTHGDVPLAASVAITPMDRG